MTEDPLAGLTPLQKFFIRGFAKFFIALRTGIYGALGVLGGFTLAQVQVDAAAVLYSAGITGLLRFLEALTPQSKPPNNGQ